MTGTLTRDAFRGRQNRVVLTPRRWRQVRGVASAQPGLDKTYPLTTVAKEPGHRGEHDIRRKTIACGNAGRVRCTRWYSCAFYHYKVHARPRVQRAPGIPHALLGGERIINDSGASRRGVANVCLESRCRHSSCPGLTRASIILRKTIFEEDGLPGIGERKRRRPSDGYARQ